MKKIIFFLFAISIGILLVGFRNTPPVNRITQLFYISSCDTPMPYAIGTVDPRFGLSEDEFFQHINEAASIWSQTAQKQLFVYDKSAKLRVNLIFDERQELNNQINTLEDDLDTKKSSLDPQIEEYKRLSASFKTRLQEYNKQVNHWNDQGGAPQEEFAKLTQEKDALQTESNRLNAIAKTLNLSTEQFNTQVGQLNLTVGSFKKALELRPEEGIYSPKENKIDIYFNINKAELVHTLAHELGHALGLLHQNSEESIMYPYTTQDLTPSTRDIAALTKICEKQHIAEIAVQKAYILLEERLREK